MAKRWPSVQDRNQQPRDWGNYTAPKFLPNAVGAVVPSSKSNATAAWGSLEAGDQAQVVYSATRVETWTCFKPGTPGLLDAIWRVSSRRRICVWRANGLLSGYSVQPATYNGLQVSDANIQAGLGLFDSTLHVYEPGEVVSLILIQQVPAAAPASTTVEFYRVRGPDVPGQVVSLGTVTLTNTLPFERVSVPPGVVDLDTDDMLFVALAAVPVADLVAMELSAHLEIA